MSDKYEFASEQWVGEARRIMLELAEGHDLTGIEASLCEKFINPPKSLSPDGAPIGWHYIVSDGKIEVNPGIIEPTLLITAHYPFVLKLARLTYAEMAANPPDPKEVEDNIKHEGDGTDLQGMTFMATLHDRLVEVTI